MINDDGVNFRRFGWAGSVISVGSVWFGSVLAFTDDSGYPHDGRADKDSYRHDRRAFSLSLYRQPFFCWL